MMTATILEIHRSALDDGPGVRTSVFLKGCSLHCSWCHNPESQKHAPELLVRRDNCIGCGRCKNICPNELLRNGVKELDRDQCTACGVCSEVCPSGTLSIAGKSMTAQEVMQVVSLDIGHYHATGGGITLTGGEPLYQADFSYELLSLAQAENIHTCVETSGVGKPNAIKALQSVTNLWLFDIKGPPDVYKQMVGAPFATVKSNLVYLLKQQAKVILRCPIITGITDNDQWIDQLCELIREMNVVYPLQGAELLPFHRLGLDKYTAVGRKAPMASVYPPDAGAIKFWEEKLQQTADK